MDIIEGERKLAHHFCPPFIFSFSSLSLFDDNKHNMGKPVLQIHLPPTGIFKKKKKKHLLFMTLSMLVLCV